MKIALIFRAIVVALSFLAFMMLALLIYVESNTLHDLPPSPTPIDCSKGFQEGISPGEVSELMGIPLVELTWLADDMKASLQIKPYGLEWVDSSNGVTCVIRILYPNLSIDILPIKDVVHPTLYPVSCGRLQETDESWIHCTGEFPATTGYIAISMFTSYPIDIAQKIADGIRLVESD